MLFELLCYKSEKEFLEDKKKRENETQAKWNSNENDSECSRNTGNIVMGLTDQTKHLLFIYST